VELPPCGLNWEPGDQIVVTTTDYFPDHSELLTIESIDGDTITVAQPLRYIHNGKRHPLTNVPAGLLDPQLRRAGAETRAAVGLLTRSIRIVSAGTALDQPFPGLDSPACATATFSRECYFGAHTVVRQGFTSSSPRWGRAVVSATIPCTSTTRAGPRPAPS
jgi:hypothetical protein